MANVVGIFRSTDSNRWLSNVSLFLRKECCSFYASHKWLMEKWKQMCEKNWNMNLKLFNFFCAHIHDIKFNSCHAIPFHFIHNFFSVYVTIFLFFKHNNKKIHLTAWPKIHSTQLSFMAQHGCLFAMQFCGQFSIMT